MSQIIADCEMHFTDLTRCNWYIFHRKKPILYCFLSLIFFNLAVICFFLSDFPLCLLIGQCSLWMDILVLDCIERLAHKMMQANLSLLFPHRVMLTEDAVQILPPVGQESFQTEVIFPYDQLYEVLYTKEFYYFRYYESSVCIFPRVMLAPWQERLLCEKLRLCCGKRFVILPY